MNQPIDLPLAALAPPPSLFTHKSPLHGQSHVARVIVHAFRLIEATGWIEEAPRLWAAVYLHDLARTHDGTCHRHGADAMKKLDTLPRVRALFARGGVRNEDYPVVHTAVVHHCTLKELDRSHDHWRLTSLLKDADALDRVRLGDLDPRYLRNAEAQSMAGFAQALFDATDGIVPAGDDHFAALWPEAIRISSARQDLA
jgi:hypothetical protein